MADNTKLQYIVELLTQGDTKKATEELKKLETAGKGSSTAISGITAGFGRLFAVMGGMTLVSRSVEAFLEQEKAVAKLNAALKAAGEFTPELSEEMIKLSEAMAQTSQFADEAILNVIAKLTAAGAKRQDIERLTQAVLDLSTLMDRDLNRATQAFAQALQGETSALKQAGIQIDETKNATDRLNDSLEAIEKKAGGQAREGIKGLSGEFNQLKKDIDGVLESLGKFFLSAYSGLRAAGKDVFSGGLFNDLMRSSGSGAVDTSGPGQSFQFPLTPESNAALMRAAQGRITTDNLAKEDLKQRQKEAQEYLDAQLKAQLELEAAEQKRGAEELRMEEEQLDAFKRGEEIKQQLANDTLLMMLDGEARLRAQIDIDHEERLRQIGATRFATSEQYEEAIAAEKKLHETTKKRFEESQTFAGRMKVDMQELEREGKEAFSTGLAHAIVTAFEEGDKAFQKFASNFLRLISEMILQTIILNTLKSFSLFAGGGQATAMANGGVRYAANGLSGVQDVNSATFFPKFNVVAGEAGREVMTVLARPRFERINGVPAQIGYAGGNRLAITSADALAGAGGGAGGNVVIEVRVSEGSEARIVENSVKQARVVIVQDMATDTPLSRVTRQRVS